MYIENVDIVLASILKIVGNWTYAIASLKKRKIIFMLTMVLLHLTFSFDT